MERRTRGETQTIIFYDGICNLCDWSVRFLMRKDRNKIFTFYSLQSEVAKSLLNAYPEVKLMDGVIMLDGGVLFLKSKAIVRALHLLDAPWSYLYVFRFVPVKVADFFYDIVAKNRYRLFGKKDRCSL